VCYSHTLEHYLIRLTPFLDFRASVLFLASCSLVGPHLPSIRQGGTIAMASLPFFSFYLSTAFEFVFSTLLHRCFSQGLTCSVTLLNSFSPPIDLYFLLLFVIISVIAETGIPIEPVTFALSPFFRRYPYFLYLLGGLFYPSAFDDTLSPPLRRVFSPPPSEDTSCDGRAILWVSFRAG